MPKPHPFTLASDDLAVTEYTEIYDGSEKIAELNYINGQLTIKTVTDRPVVIIGQIKAQSISIEANGPLDINRSLQAQDTISISSSSEVTINRNLRCRQLTLSGKNTDNNRVILKGSNNVLEVNEIIAKDKVNFKAEHNTTKAVIRVKAMVLTEAGSNFAVDNSVFQANRVCNNGSISAKQSTFACHHLYQAGYTEFDSCTVSITEDFSTLPGAAQRTYLNDSNFTCCVFILKEGSFEQVNSRLKTESFNANSGRFISTNSSELSVAGLMVVGERGRVKLASDTQCRSSDDILVEGILRTENAKIVASSLVSTPNSMVVLEESHFEIAKKFQLAGHIKTNTISIESEECQFKGVLESFQKTTVRANQVSITDTAGLVEELSVLADTLTLASKNERILLEVKDSNFIVDTFQQKNATKLTGCYIYDKSHSGVHRIDGSMQMVDSVIDSQHSLSRGRWGVMRAEGSLLNYGNMSLSGPTETNDSAVTCRDLNIEKGMYYITGSPDVAALRQLNQQFVERAQTTFPNQGISPVNEIKNQSAAVLGETVVAKETNLLLQGRAKAELGETSILGELAINTSDCSSTMTDISSSASVNINDFGKLNAGDLNCRGSIELHNRSQLITTRTDHSGEIISENSIYICDGQHLSRTHAKTTLKNSTEAFAINWNEEGQASLAAGAHLTATNLTTQFGSLLTLKQSRIVSDEFEHGGELRADTVAKLHVMKKLHAKDLSTLKGDRLECEVYDGEVCAHASIKLLHSLSYKGYQLVNLGNISTIDGDNNQLFFGLDRSLVNNGIISAKVLSISSPVVYSSVMLDGQDSLDIKSLVYLSTGLRGQSDANISGLVIRWELLPHIPTQLPDPSRLISPSQIYGLCKQAIAVCYPNLINSYNLLEMGVKGLYYSGGLDKILDYLAEETWQESGISFYKDLEKLGVKVNEKDIRQHLMDLHQSALDKYKKEFPGRRNHEVVSHAVKSVRVAKEAWNAGKTVYRAGQEHQWSEDSKKRRGLGALLTRDNIPSLKSVDNYLDPVLPEYVNDDTIPVDTSKMYWSDSNVEVDEANSTATMSSDYDTHTQSTLSNISGSELSESSTNEAVVEIIPSDVTPETSQVDKSSNHWFLPDYVSHNDKTQDSFSFGVPSFNATAIFDSCAGGISQAASAFYDSGLKPMWDKRTLIAENFVQPMFPQTTYTSLLDINTPLSGGVNVTRNGILCCDWGPQFVVFNNVNCLWYHGVSGSYAVVNDISAWYTLLHHDLSGWFDMRVSAKTAIGFDGCEISGTHLRIDVKDDWLGQVNIRQRNSDEPNSIYVGRPDEQLVFDVRNTSIHGISYAPNFALYGGNNEYHFQKFTAQSGLTATLDNDKIIASVLTLKKGADIEFKGKVGFYNPIEGDSTIDISAQLRSDEPDSMLDVNGDSITGKPDIDTEGTAVFKGKQIKELGGDIKAKKTIYHAENCVETDGLNDKSADTQIYSDEHIHVKNSTIANLSRFSSKDKTIAESTKIGLTQGCVGDFEELIVDAETEIASQSSQSSEQDQQSISTEGSKGQSEGPSSINAESQQTIKSSEHDATADSSPKADDTITESSDESRVDDTVVTDKNTTESENAKKQADTKTQDEAKDKPRKPPERQGTMMTEKGIKVANGGRLRFSDLNILDRRIIKKQLEEQQKQLAAKSAHESQDNDTSLSESSPQQRSTLTDRTEHVSSDAGSAEDDLKTKPVIDADGGTIEMTEVTTHDHDITRQGGGDLHLRDVISLQANLTDEGNAGSLEMSGDNHIEGDRHTLNGRGSLGNEQTVLQAKEEGTVGPNADYGYEGFVKFDAQDINLEGGKLHSKEKDSMLVTKGDSITGKLDIDTEGTAVFKGKQIKELGGDIKAKKTIYHAENCVETDGLNDKSADTQIYSDEHIHVKNSTIANLSRFSSKDKTIAESTKIGLTQGCVGDFEELIVDAETEIASQSSQSSEQDQQSISTEGSKGQSEGPSSINAESQQTIKSSEHDATADSSPKADDTITESSDESRVDDTVVTDKNTTESENAKKQADTKTQDEAKDKPRKPPERQGTMMTEKGIKVANGGRLRFSDLNILDRRIIKKQLEEQQKQLAAKSAHESQDNDTSLSESSPQQRSTLTDRTEHVSSDAGSAEDDLKTKPVIDADGGTIEMTEVTTHDHDITRQGGGDLHLRDVISLQANLTDEGNAGSLEMSGDNHIEGDRHTLNGRGSLGNEQTVLQAKEEGTVGPNADYGYEGFVKFDAQDINLEGGKLHSENKDSKLVVQTNTLDATLAMTSAGTVEFNAQALKKPVSGQVQAAVTVFDVKEGLQQQNLTDTSENTLIISDGDVEVTDSSTANLAGTDARGQLIVKATYGNQSNVSVKRDFRGRMDGLLADGHGAAVISQRPEAADKKAEEATEQTEHSSSDATIADDGSDYSAEKHPEKPIPVVETLQIPSEITPEEAPDRQGILTVKNDIETRNGGKIELTDVAITCNAVKTPSGQIRLTQVTLNGNEIVRSEQGTCTLVSSHVDVEAILDRASTEATSGTMDFLGKNVIKTGELILANEGKLTEGWCLLKVENKLIISDNSNYTIAGTLYLDAHGANMTIGNTHITCLDKNTLLFIEADAPNCRNPIIDGPGTAAMIMRKHENFGGQWTSHEVILGGEALRDVKARDDAFHSRRQFRGVEPGKDSADAGLKTLYLPGDFEQPRPKNYRSIYGDTEENYGKSYGYRIFAKNIKLPYEWNSPGQLNFTAQGGVTLGADMEASAIQIQAKGKISKRWKKGLIHLNARQGDALIHSETGKIDAPFLRAKGNNVSTTAKGDVNMPSCRLEAENKVTAGSYRGKLNMAPEEKREKRKGKSKKSYSVSVIRAGKGNTQVVMQGGEEIAQYIAVELFGDGDGIDLRGGFIQSDGSQVLSARNGDINIDGIEGEERKKTGLIVRDSDDIPTLIGSLLQSNNGDILFIAPNGQVHHHGAIRSVNKEKGHKVLTSAGGDINGGTLVASRRTHRKRKILGIHRRHDKKDVKKLEKINASTVHMKSGNGKINLIGTDFGEAEMEELYLAAPKGIDLGDDTVKSSSSGVKISFDLQGLGAEALKSLMKGDIEGALNAMLKELPLFKNIMDIIKSPGGIDRIVKYFNLGQEAYDELAAFAEAIQSDKSLETYLKGKGIVNKDGKFDPRFKVFATITKYENKKEEKMGAQVNAKDIILDATDKDGNKTGDVNIVGGMSVRAEHMKVRGNKLSLEGVTLHNEQKEESLTASIGVQARQDFMTFGAGKAIHSDSQDIIVNQQSDIKVLELDCNELSLDKANLAAGVIINTSGKPLKKVTIISGQSKRTVDAHEGYLDTDGTFKFGVQHHRTQATQQSGIYFIQAHGFSAESTHLEGAYIQSQSEVPGEGFTTNELTLVTLHDYDQGFGVNMSGNTDATNPKAEGNGLNTLQAGGYYKNYKANIHSKVEQGVDTPGIEPEVTKDSGFEIGRISIPVSVERVANNYDKIKGLFSHKQDEVAGPVDLRDEFRQHSEDSERDVFGPRIEEDFHDVMAGAQRPADEPVDAEIELFSSAALLSNDEKDVLAARWDDIEKNQHQPTDSSSTSPQSRIDNIFRDSVRSLVQKHGDDFPLSNVMINYSQATLAEKKAMILSLRHIAKLESQGDISPVQSLLLVKEAVSERADTVDEQGSSIGTTNGQLEFYNSGRLLEECIVHDEYKSEYSAFDHWESHHNQTLAGKIGVGLASAFHDDITRKELRIRSEIRQKRLAESEPRWAKILWTTYEIVMDSSAFIILEAAGGPVAAFGGHSGLTSFWDKWEHYHAVTPGNEQSLGDFWNKHGDSISTSTLNGAKLGVVMGPAGKLINKLPVKYLPVALQSMQRAILEAPVLAAGSSIIHEGRLPTREELENTGAALILLNAFFHGINHLVNKNGHISSEPLQKQTGTSYDVKQNSTHLYDGNIAKSEYIPKSQVEAIDRVAKLALHSHSKKSNVEPVSLTDRTHVANKYLQSKKTATLDYDSASKSQSASRSIVYAREMDGGDARPTENTSIPAADNTTAAVESIKPFSIDGKDYQYNANGFVYCDTKETAVNFSKVVKNLPPETRRSLAAAANKGLIILVHEDAHIANYTSAEGGLFISLEENGIRTQLRNRSIDIEGRNSSLDYDGLVMEISCKNSTAKDLSGVAVHELKHFEIFDNNLRLVREMNHVKNSRANFTFDDFQNSTFLKLVDPILLRDLSVEGKQLQRSRFHQAYIEDMREFLHDNNLESPYEIDNKGSPSAMSADYALYTNTIGYFRDHIPRLIESLVVAGKKMLPRVSYHDKFTQLLDDAIKNEPKPLSSFIKSLVTEIDTKLFEYVLSPIEKLLPREGQKLISHEQLFRPYCIELDPTQPLPRTLSEWVAEIDPNKISAGLNNIKNQYMKIDFVKNSQFYSGHLQRVSHICDNPNQYRITYNELRQMISTAAMELRAEIISHHAQSEHHCPGSTDTVAPRTSEFIRELNKAEPSKGGVVPRETFPKQFSEQIDASQKSSQLLSKRSFNDSKTQEATKNETKATSRLSTEESRFEGLSEAISIDYNNAGLQGAAVYHGTTSKNMQSLLGGLENRGRGFGGAGTYFALEGEKAVAVNYSEIAKQRAASQDGAKASKPVVLEGQLNPDNKLRVARIRIANRNNLSKPNIKKGIFPADWAKDPELQAFMHDNFDIIEVVGAAEAGYAIDTDRFLVIHESAGKDAILWQNSQCHIPPAIVDSALAGPETMEVMPQVIPAYHHNHTTQVSSAEASNLASAGAASLLLRSQTSRRVVSDQIQPDHPPQQASSHASDESSSQSSGYTPVTLAKQSKDKSLDHHVKQTQPTLNVLSMPSVSVPTFELEQTSPEILQDWLIKAKPPQAPDVTLDLSRYEQGYKAIFGNKSQSLLHAKLFEMVYGYANDRFQRRQQGGRQVNDVSYLTPKQCRDKAGHQQTYGGILTADWQLVLFDARSSEGRRVNHGAAANGKPVIMAFEITVSSRILPGESMNIDTMFIVSPDSGHYRPVIDDSLHDILMEVFIHNGFTCDNTHIITDTHVENSYSNPPKSTTQALQAYAMRKQAGEDPAVSHYANLATQPPRLFTSQVAEKLSSSSSSDILSSKSPSATMPSESEDKAHIRANKQTSAGLASDQGLFKTKKSDPRHKVLEQLFVNESSTSTSKPDKSANESSSETSQRFFKQKPSLSQQQSVQSSVVRLVPLEVTNRDSLGDCLFNSLAFNLGVTITDPQYLRNEIANYIDANKGRFVDAAIAEDTVVFGNGSSAYKFVGFSEYIDLIREPGAWGNHLSLVAVAEMYSRRIAILKDGQQGLAEHDIIVPDNIEQGSEPMFVFYTGGHYLPMIQIGDMDGNQVLNCLREKYEALSGSSRLNPGE